MGQPGADSKQAGTGQCNPYPVLDYVKQLPLAASALERPPSPFGYVSPIVPKRTGSPLAYGPAEATYYYPVALPKCNPTGVFFPSGFYFPPVIDVILYFHGFKQGDFVNINDYWNGNLHGIRLREDVNASGKRAVLIAPTLGEKPGSSVEGDMGIFARVAGGDTFLAEVLRWIGKSVPQYTSRCLTPSIGKLVLAGHSGAGVILTVQAWSMNTPVCEVWGFDSLYGGQDDVKSWISLARVHPEMKFFFHWGTSPLQKSSTSLEELSKTDLPNITVKKTDALPGQAPNSNEHHFSVLTENFATRVKNASCFS